METGQQTRKANSLKKAAWFILIVLLATAIGMLAAWRAPALNLYAQDWLMRSRGNLPVPEDIVIVAIDEPSIAKLGRFPWSRELIARVLNTISSAEPKSIALDILYSEQTDQANDEWLSEAIKKSGKIVISEQLIKDSEAMESNHSVWLRSLPMFEQFAAGRGHVNVETERDGTARQMLLRLADDNGEARWALAIETIRVGDNLNPNEIRKKDRSIQIGTREVPVDETEHNLSLKVKDSDGGLNTIEPLRMTIDYIGASGSFAAQTFSFADVLENRVAPERFRGKYVLIGATAATLGDRIATPFVHAESDDGDQHGELMPGVEILANSINTVLRERFYSHVSDWTAALCAAIAAIAVLFLTGLSAGKFEAAKQIGGLMGIAALILFGGYLTYFYFLIIPPIVPMVVSFAAAAPLALLRRSLAASAGIDERINELLAIENRLLIKGPTPITAKFSNNFLESENASYDKRNRIFPRGLEWKTQTLGFLSRDLIAHSLFVDSALRSLEEGLLIADANGSIIFANGRAEEILGFSERGLIGSSIFARIVEAQNKAEDTIVSAEEMFARLLIEQTNITREIVIGNSAPSHYALRLSTVVSQHDTGGGALGIVATLSDVTQHHELQQIKNDVITLVTHELRTPLTAIQGMSEVLTEYEVEPEARRKMLATINNESKRLARMINEYLDITRIESGIQKALFTNVNVTNLLEQTLFLLEPLAAQRDIKIICQFEVNLPMIFADAGMLAQALTNIVGNAIKYTAEKTKITVEVKKVGEQLKISVVDEGFGISEEQLPHIFEKFYRVPHRHTAGVPGTGLGLALTREIIELHGGRITVESKLNVGSTFTVYLPFAPEI